MIDFTIPGSTVNLFYQTKSGKMLNKSFKKHSGKTFYINGEAFIDTNG